MTATDVMEDSSTPKGGLAIEATSIDDLNAEARIAADMEHNLTFIEAVRTYPTAVAWAIFFSLGVIMAVHIHSLHCIIRVNVFRLSTLSFLAIFTQPQHFRKILGTSTKDNILFPPHGKQA